MKTSGLWAPEPYVRPAAWLDNFTNADERLLAAVLLDNFLFYADGASDRLLVAAYDRLEDDTLLGRVPSVGGPRAFIDSFVFTPVEGEEPRPTDSGKTLCRKLRDLVELDDRRFFDPPLALDEARHGLPVVFVDDFIGSGQQLIHTWKRHYRSDQPTSFREAHAARPFPAICLALVATRDGLDNVRREAPDIVVVATHVLDDSYSVKHLPPPTLVPPIDNFQGALHAFLKAYAPSLDLKPYLRTGDQALYGFAELGLLLAFQQGIPDATVPLLWGSGPGRWIRLVKRSS